MRPRPQASTLFPYTTLFRSSLKEPARCRHSAFSCTFVPAASETSSERIVGVRSVMPAIAACARSRSEEHTSELQSRGHLVCRLLLEKKKYKLNDITQNRARP